MIIPEKMRTDVLQLLHSTHMGASAIHDEKHGETVHLVATHGLRN